MLFQVLERVHVGLVSNEWQTLDFLCPEGAPHVESAPSRRVVITFRVFGGDYGLGLDVETIRGPAPASPSGGAAPTWDGKPITSAVVSNVSTRLWGDSCPVSVGNRLLSINCVPVGPLSASSLRDLLYPPTSTPLTCIMLEFEVEP